ncbi:MAG TPA: hypothetical protein VMT28_04240, partial [Terriglobales bacterium]|nr:hypothetical protein [Terriglobales bacterium]
MSSTPHETKVGLVEDDQLAEIYLERENEYTLAGSIYKGRVTRVLPGMQSAFVDIGLERDAFLYVSDFMELEDSEEVEDVPAGRPVFNHSQPQSAEGQTAAAVAPAPIRETEPMPQESAGEAPEPQAEPREPLDVSEGQQRDPRGWRGRRRRRGRRGERMPESKFARPSPDQSREAPRESPRGEYGPPPGYQPILLPGESISKYQRYARPQPPAQMQAASASPERPEMP